MNKKVYQSLLYQVKAIEIRSFNFVHVKVHVDEYFTRDFGVLQKLPPFSGIPHYFIYDWEGIFLHSQDTVIFEEGKSYNYDKLFSFFTQWGHKTQKNELM